MSSVLLIAFKDLKIVSRDKAALFFLIGMPVMMGVFFGFMYQGVGNKPKAGSIKLAIVDEDESKMSASLIEKLEANETLVIERLSFDDAVQQLKDRKNVGVVVIPKGFGENAGIIWSDQPAKLKIGKDPSRAAESAMLEGFLMEAIGQLVPERMSDIDSIKSMVEKQKKDIENDPDATASSKLLVGTMFDSMLTFFERINEVQENTSEGAIAENAPGFQFAEIETFDAFQPNTNSTIAKVRTSWDISFPAAILWGVMGCASGFAISLVRERSRGTLLRLQTAPLSTLELIFGKGTACYLSILGVVAMMIGLGIILGMRPGNPFYLVVSTLVIAYCYVGIMMAMSVIGKTEEAVGGAGWAVNVVLAMFGGGMIPLAFMPGFMKTLSNFSPVAWSILSLEGAIWRGFTLAEFVWPWSCLLLIGTIGFSLGIVVFQKRKAE